jgi:histidinol-phosphate aminotransferase
VNDPLLVHGGTDSDPEPRYDFSSNANALGPCPHVLNAVKRADFSRYPDPLYADLRHRLATSHGATAEQIVIGAGASELILRLIRHFPGPVLQLGPTFSEYARGARVADRELLTASSPDEFLSLQRTQAGIGFICWPNNPTGDAWGADFVRRAASAGQPLVVDLAYGPLCRSGFTGIEAVAAEAFRIYSPNKSYGLTGLRGAYIVAPRDGVELSALAPSWVVGRGGAAMLEASVEPEARTWLTQSLPQVHRWRTRLASSLRDLRIPVHESPATFLLADVGDGGRITAGLRELGLRVRDATSFGLKRCIRLSGQAPGARRVLVAALKTLL